MNQYPPWKYVLIVLVVLIGTLYALPNMYGDDPAIQVTTTRGFTMSSGTSGVIDDALAGAGISIKSSEQTTDNRLLYRFHDAERTDGQRHTGEQQDADRERLARPIRGIVARAGDDPFHAIGKRP